MNKEIETKIDEIINEIKSSDLYKKYLLLKDKINSNKELMELINKVKVMQKDLVHKKVKKEDLDKVMDELDNNPLYREYNNCLYEINNTYGIIESSLNNYFDKIIN